MFAGLLGAISIHTIPKCFNLNLGKIGMFTCYLLSSSTFVYLQLRPSSLLHTAYWSRTKPKIVNVPNYALGLDSLNQKVPKSVDSVRVCLAGKARIGQFLHILFCFRHWVTAKDYNIVL